MKPGLCGWAMGALLCAQRATALEATISAEYRGAALGRFTNTTPLASYCRQWPADCANAQAVELPITYTKATIKGAADSRDHYYIRVPGSREVDVYHQLTGESHRLKFAITAVSQQVQWPLGGNPAFTAYVRGGCSYRRSYGWPATPSRALYLWSVNNPQAPSGCHSIADRMQPGYVATPPVSEMGVAYNLDMPAPYRMKPGIYTGSVTYSIGPGGDFDFGNGVTDLNGNSLTLHFRLDVQHAFMFDFPPGSERAVLEPEGGWKAWMAGRGTPRKLYRDLPFRLWSTGPFKVYKLCQYYNADRCGIRNENGHEVPVDVALSLPAGIEYLGRPVQRLPLPNGRGAALQFDAAMPALNRPGQLHFQVDQGDVRSMLDHAGSTYTGLVTVVFDAEP